MEISLTTTRKEGDFTDVVVLIDGKKSLDFFSFDPAFTDKEIQDIVNLKMKELGYAV